MAKEPAIRSLTIQNLLSFGPEPTAVELRNLNVLIGPNGSGKSNLIEVLGLLQNTPKELGTAISNGGPIDEWLWKGGARSRTAPIAVIEVSLSAQHCREPVRYRLAFTRGAGFRFEIREESISDRRESTRDPLPADLNPQRSVLALRGGAEAARHIATVFEAFKLYRDWEFGTITQLRQPCDASLPNASLEEDFSNLGVVLDRLLAIPPVKEQILASVRTFYEDTKDLRTTIEAGRVQTRLEEKHLNATIPLIRMSDGTLRWLTLLTILLNPDPPPLVCIEEPELGLHPDMIHELAKLLIDASTRMQLIITTHSDRLVEEFTDTPEAVVVCEKENGASKFRRLEREKLTAWLEEYTLGQIWTRGQIGGTRW